MQKTALVIVDMQNAFCSPKGSFQKRGFKLFNLRLVIKNIRKLLAFARKKRFLVIFTKLEFKKDYSNAGLLIKRFPEIVRFGGYQKRDSKISPALKPKRDELVITKTRFDPFVGTNLEKILKKNKIKRIIVSGVLTNVCVECTVHSAFDRDFEVVVIKDAVTTYSKKLQNASLVTIQKHFGDIISLHSLKKRGYSKVNFPSANDSIAWINSSCSAF